MVEEEAKNMGVPSNRPPAADRRGALLGLLLVTSGFCGISYEVLYGRLLGDLVGSQFLVSAGILLTFLLGMGVGTLAAHRFWRWLPLVEAGIGGYAALFAGNLHRVDRLLYDVPRLETMEAQLALCVLLLLLPAFLIGISLPVMSGYLARLSPARRFASAYAAYNLGAAVVALAMEWWLIRFCGIRGATFLVAGVNLAVAVGLWLGFGDVRRTPPPVRAPWLRCGLRPLAGLVLASVASAVLQLMAIKIGECLFGPFRETFAMVLAVVLGAMALGSWLVARWRLSFATLMVVAQVGLLGLLAGFPGLAHLYAALHPSWPPALLKLAVVVVAFGVPALAFGATIPAILVRERQVARESGWLLFVSSLANAAGFLLMVFVLHPRLDYGPMLALVAVLAFAAMVTAGNAGRRRLAAGLVMVLLLAPAATRLWDEDLLYLGYTAYDSSEELSRTSRRISLPEKFKGPQDIFSIVQSGGHPRFFINGYISMSLDSVWEPMVGAVGAVYAPRDDRALVLGVGSGNTASVVAALFDHTDGVEINGAVLANLHRMREYNEDLEHNPRVRLIQDDAIHFVKAGDSRYDLVINTVTTPLYFSSAKLYTEDFLAAVRQRLAPGGLYVTWVDSRVGDQGMDIMLRTLSRVFPHTALAWVRSSYFLLLCSDQPIRPRQPMIVADDPGQARRFRQRFFIEPEWLAYNLLVTDAAALVREPEGPVNRLDRPELEFAMARLRQRGYPRFKERLRAKMDLAELRRALSGALAFDPVRLVVHCYRLMGDSSLTERWFHLAQQADSGFSERLRRRMPEMEMALARRAGTAPAFHKAGSRLLQAEAYRPAVTAFRRALDLDPFLNNAHFNLGACLEYLGDYPAALEEYRREWQVDPDDEDVAYRLGRVLVKMGRPGEALAYLERAMAENPGAGVRRYLERARAAAGRKAGAG